MLAKRILVILVLLPIGILAIEAGGWWFAGFVLAAIGFAAREYVSLMQASGFQPPAVLVVGGSLLLVVQRQIDGFESSPLALSFLVLASMTYHLVQFERGRESAAADFGVSLGGIFYLGWIGAYMLSMRNLPEGKWWVYLTLSTVWAADVFAFVVGSRWGRVHLAPRLSPKKTWEGYLAGIAGGLIVGTGLGQLFPVLGAHIPPQAGIWMGLLMGIFPTLGDLGESMIKRLAGAKDSSHLLPGHGGAFDRIDSWLWAVVIGFYLVERLWL
jgi:phosphatidate cytidylyltransferase